MRSGLLKALAAAIVLFALAAAVTNRAYASATWPECSVSLADIKNKGLHSNRYKKFADKIEKNATPARVATYNYATSIEVDAGILMTLNHNQFCKNVVRDAMQFSFSIMKAELRKKSALASSYLKLYVDFQLLAPPLYFQDDEGIISTVNELIEIDAAVYGATSKEVLKDRSQLARAYRHSGHVQAAAKIDLDICARYKNSEILDDEKTGRLMVDSPSGISMHLDMFSIGQAPTVPLPVDFSVESPASAWTL